MTRPGPTGAQTANSVARQVFAGLPPAYDRLGYLLSFGQDRRWRRTLVDQIVAARPRLVLDVATGPGGVALEISRRSGAQLVGVDLLEPMLAQARQRIGRTDGGDRVLLAAARAEQLPFPAEAFDAVSFSYLLRYVDDPAATLAELARCLKPGGTLASLEFFRPPARAWRAAWWGYTRSLLPALGLVSGGLPWYRVGRFLGPSISAHYAAYPLDWHVRAWRQAGFPDVGWRVMSLGGGLVMWGTKAAG